MTSPTQKGEREEAEVCPTCGALPVDQVLDIHESCGGVDSRRHVSSGESASHREGQQQRSAGFAPGPHDTPSKGEREEALEAWSFPQLIEEYATAKSILTLSAERGAFENYPMQSRIVSELWGAIMSRLLSSSKAEVEMREALTPSGDTKAAYSGEFKFSITETFEDDDGDVVERSRDILVPWTTIKEIMAAIAARAALSPKEAGK